MAAKSREELGLEGLERVCQEKGSHDSRLLFTLVVLEVRSPTSSIAITQNLLEMHIPRPLTGPAESESGQESVCQESVCFFFFIYLIYLFLAVLGLCCCVQAFSSCSESGGYSSLWCAGFSLRWLLLLRSTGSRCAGFSSCGTRAQ